MVRLRSIKNNKNNKIKINDWQNKHINSTRLIQSDEKENNNNIYY